MAGGRSDAAGIAMGYLVAQRKLRGCARFDPHFNPAVAVVGWICRSSNVLCVLRANVKRVDSVAPSPLLHSSELEGLPPPYPQSNIGFEHVKLCVELPGSDAIELCTVARITEPSAVALD